MLSFLLTNYRKLLAGELIMLAAVHMVSLLSYSPTHRLSTAVDTVVTIVTLVVFAFVPFVLAFDALSRFRESIPGPRVGVGLYLGASVNLFAGMVSVGFGLLQAALGHYVRHDPETATGMYLLALPLGLITALVIGAVMGWAGQGGAYVARVVRT